MKTESKYLIGAALLISGTIFGVLKVAKAQDTPKPPTITDANLFYFGGNLAPTSTGCINQLEVRIDADNNVYICSPKTVNTWTKLSGTGVAP